MQARCSAFPTGTQIKKKLTDTRNLYFLTRKLGTKDSRDPRLPLHRGKKPRGQAGQYREAKILRKYFRDSLGAFIFISVAKYVYGVSNISRYSANYEDLFTLNFRKKRHPSFLSFFTK